MTAIHKFFLIFFEKANFIANCIQENALFLRIHFPLRFELARSFDISGRTKEWIETSKSVFLVSKPN